MNREMGHDVLKKLEKAFDSRKELKNTLKDCMDSRLSKMLTTDRISTKKGGFTIEKRLLRKIESLASESDLEMDKENNIKKGRRGRSSVKLRKASSTIITIQTENITVDSNIQKENKENIEPNID